MSIDFSFQAMGPRSADNTRSNYQLNSTKQYHLPLTLFILGGGGVFFHLQASKFLRTPKRIYVWYPKSRAHLNTIHEKNDVIETQEELATVKKQLKHGNHTCLIMRMEHPRAYDIR